MEQKAHSCIYTDTHTDAGTHMQKHSDMDTDTGADTDRHIEIVN